MSNPTSNFGWQMPTPTDLVTDLPADFEVFGQAVDTSMADLKGGTTGQILAKATNTDMDFAWIANDQGDITGVTATSPITGGGTTGAISIGIQDATTSVKGAVQLSDSTSTTSSILASTPTATKSAYDLAAAAVPKSTVTTAGDVIYATGSGAVTRLGIGTTGQILTVSSGAPAWATAAGGGMTLLSTTTLSGASTTISSINQSYKDLYCVVYGVTMASSSSNFTLAPNGVTNKCQYVMTYIVDAGTSVSTTFDVGGLWRLTSQSNQLYSNANNVYSFTINDYSSTTTRKTINSQAGFLTQGSAGGANFAGGAYMETTAVSSLVFTQASNFSTGTVLIYGVK